MGPRGDLIKFGHGMVDVFDRMFGNFDDFWNDFPEINFYSYASFPPTDIYVKDNKDLVFEFAVAGYPEDAISIDFHSDYMTIKTEIKDAKEEKGHFLKRGIRYSKVEERYYVPSSKYNRDEAKAELKSGLLRVVIPAKEEVKPKPLKITIG